MDIFNSRYFNVNRKLLTCIGLWPRESKKKNYTRTFVLIALVIFLIPQFFSVIVHRENIDRLMLGLLFFLMLSAVVAKMLGLIIAEDNLRELIKAIADNWLAVGDSNERNILHKYSEKGRKLAIFYSVMMSMLAVNIAVAPLIPKILDIIIPLSEPRGNVYILQGELFLDRDVHFVKLSLCDTVTIGLVTLVTVTVDTMYLVCSLHCCALYAIVRYRLLKLKGNVHDDSPTEYDDSYEWLVYTVQLHQKALNFTLTLSDSYSTSLLLILVINLLIIPLNGCSILMSLDEPLNALPYAIVTVALTLHLLLLFFPGQMVLDHGLDLCDNAYYNEWYTTSVRTRKLLAAFMLRCSQPASISAAGLVLMNLENYSKIMKTSISYVTVAASFR